VIPSTDQSSVGSGAASTAVPGSSLMRTINYIFAVTSMVLGVLMILFVLTQTTSLVSWGFPPRMNTGIAIGIVLVLNGLVRIWFAQDDER
jgi:hypothetical protein